MAETRTLLFFLLLALALFATACGGGVGTDGDVVGGTCSGASDCAGGSSCLMDSMYPDGTCTVSCSSQDDCPGGSTCVTESGGRCLLSCSSDSDCREGYNCEEKSTPGDGHAFVCIN